LIAFGSAALLLLGRAILFDDEIAMRHGAILLGLAANCKNEGLALLAAVGAGLGVTQPRRLVRLWPSLLIPVPWLGLRFLHGLPTDILEGSVRGRIAAHVRLALPMVRDLLRCFGDPCFWVAALLTLLVAKASVRRRERFVIVTVAVQLLLYVLSYLAT